MFVHVSKPEMRDVLIIYLPYRADNNVATFVVKTIHKF